MKKKLLYYYVYAPVFFLDRKKKLTQVEGKTFFVMQTAHLRSEDFFFVKKILPGKSGL